MRSETTNDYAQGRRPDPDDGDDDDDEGQDSKGGPSSGKKGKDQAGPDTETGDKEEDVVDVMSKTIARERLLSTKRPSDPSWVFINMSYQAIRIWLMPVQDHFQRNSHLLTIEVDQIKYA